MSKLMTDKKVNPPMKKGQSVDYALTDKGEMIANNLASDIDTDKRYSNLFKEDIWRYIWYDY